MTASSGTKVIRCGSCMLCLSLIREPGWRRFKSKSITDIKLPHIRNISEVIADRGTLPDNCGSNVE